MWKKLTSAFMSLVLVVGLCPGMAYAETGGVKAASTNLAAQDEGGAVEKIAYEGDTVKIVKNDLASEFGMLSNPSGDMKITWESGKVHVSFTPSNQSVYSGFYIETATSAIEAGATYPVNGLSEDKWIGAQGEASSFTYDFSLPASYCGYAWPVAPIKTTEKDGGTTRDQYYLAVPPLEKIPGYEAPANEPTVYELTPANTEKMFVVVKVVIEDYPGAQDYMTYYLNSGSYKYGFSGSQDEAVAAWDFDASKPKSDDERWAAKAEEEITFSHTTYTGEKASGTAKKPGYRIPITVPEGKTEFSVPVVAYASDFTARSFAVNLTDKTVVPGSASDEAALAVTSSVADVAAAATGAFSYTGYVRPYAGNQNTSGNPLSNDFVGSLKINLSDNATYDKAYAVTYQKAPWLDLTKATVNDPVEADYADIAVDGSLTLPIVNEYDTDPKTTQLNGNIIKVRMHVAGSAPFEEAGQWVDRTFQLDFTSRTAATLAISGDALTSKGAPDVLADGTYQATKVTTDVTTEASGMIMVTAATVVVKDGQASALVTMKGTGADRLYVSDTATKDTIVAEAVAEEQKEVGGEEGGLIGGLKLEGSSAYSFWPIPVTLGEPTVYAARSASHFSKQDLAPEKYYYVHDFQIDEADLERVSDSTDLPVTPQQEAQRYLNQYFLDGKVVTSATAASVTGKNDKVTIPYYDASSTKISSVVMKMANAGYQTGWFFDSSILNSTYFSNSALKKIQYPQGAKGTVTFSPKEQYRNEGMAFKATLRLYPADANYSQYDATGAYFDKDPLAEQEFTFTVEPLPEDRDVTIEVVDAVSKEPISDARVTVKKDADKTTVEPVDGAYTLAVPGTYTVTAQADGYLVPGTEDAVLTQEGYAPKKKGEKLTLALIKAEQSKSAITFDMKDQMGDAVQGANLTVYRWDDAAKTAVAAEADGSYKLYYGVRYGYFAEGEGYETKIHSLVPEGDATEEVLVNKYLSEQRFTFRVYDSKTNETLEGVKLVVKYGPASADADTYSVVEPDENGVYTIPIDNKVIAYGSKTGYESDDLGVFSLGFDPQKDCSFSLKALPDADYFAVDAAKAKAEALDRDKYMPVTLAKLDAALAAVPEGKKTDEQDAVDEAAKAIEAALAGLVEVVADGTYSIADLSSTLGMPGIPKGKELYAPQAIVKDGKATLVFATSTYRFDALAFGSIDAIGEDATQVPAGVTPVQGTPLYADVLTGDVTKDFKGYLFAMPLSDEQFAEVAADASAQLPYLVKYIADPDGVIKGHDSDWYKPKSQPMLTVGALTRTGEVTELPEASADYSDVIAQIKAVPSDLSIYTEASIADLQSALAAVVTDKKASDQAAVDAMANAVKDKIAALVERIPVDDAVVDADLSLTFNGAKQAPSVKKVTVGDKELALGDDYTVSYLDLLGDPVEETKNAGDYQLVITGVNGYCGAKAIDFSIAPLALTEDNLEIVSAAPNGVEFTGGDIDVSVTARVLIRAAENGEPAEYFELTDDDFAFVPGTVSAVGTYGVTIIGKGNCVGRVAKKDVLKVVGVDLSKDANKAQLAPKGEVAYTGDPLDVEWALTYGEEGASTVPASDYDVAYSVEGDELTGTLSEDGKPLSAGTYKATATAKGEDFTGSVVGLLIVAPFDLDADDGEDAKVAVSVASKAYTGEEQQSGDVAVTFGGVAVSADDFTVAGAKGTDAGSYDVTVTGKGNFTGSKKAAFTIEPVALGDVAELAELAHGIYSGKAGEPTVAVSKKDAESKYALSASDYDVSFGEDVTVKDAGDYAFTVTAKEGGNYKGSLSGTYAIEPLAISDKSVTVAAIASEAFDGKAHNPEPAITFNEAALKKGVDYTVEYDEDMTNAGEKAIVVKGEGNFTGSTTAKFTVSKRALGKDMIRFKSGEVWASDYSTSDASEKPIVGVAVGDAVFAEGEGFSVSYVGNNAVVTATADGNFSGKASQAWNIAALSLEGGAVELDSAAVAFTGKAQEPSVKVTVPGSGTLKADRDYTVSYLDAKDSAVSAGDLKDAGEYTVLVSGKGNYGGQLTGTFTIVPQAIDADSVTVAGISDVAYDGKAAEPTPSVSFGGETLEAGKDYTVSYADNETAGTAKVVITGKGNFSGEKTVEFEIAKNNSLKDFKIVGADGSALGSYPYTGSRIKPEIKVVSQSDETVEFAGTTVAVYTSNINAGTAKVTVVGTGCYEGVISAEYQIAKLDIAKADIAIANATYTGRAITPTAKVTYKVDDETTIELVEDVDYGIEYIDNKNVGTASAVLVGSDNFEGVAFGSFTITKGASKVTLRAKTATYNGKAVAVDAATVTGSTGTVSYTYYSDAKATKAIDASKVVNAGTYYAKATVAADENYAAATSAAVKITIKKAASPMTVKVNNQTAKLANAKKADQTFTFAKAFKITKNQGKVSYAKNKKDKNKNITVTSKGIMLKKGTKKKTTYKVLVDVTDAGGTNYNKVTKTVTLQIVVK